MDRLTERTRAAGTELALGIEARCRALLGEGPIADELFREALTRLGRCRLAPDRARAHLLYGEWLRREGRLVDAREQLRTAHEMLSAMGMDAFAQRARDELRAAGEAAPERTAEDRDGLTPPGGADRGTRRRGLHEHGDRGAAVPQPADGRAAPAQGVRQARHQLTQVARNRTATSERVTPAHPAGALHAPGPEPDR